MIDKASKVLLMNQAAGILLRIAPAEAKGKPIQEIFRLVKGNEEISSPDSPLRKALEEVSTVVIGLEDDLFCKNRSGKLFPITASVTGLLHYGNIGGVIIFNDVTQLKEIDQMKTEFVSVASHQLRTPLTAIKLFVEMLWNEEVGKLNQKQKEYIDNVQQSTERMISLVNDLLNVSRVEAGRVKIEATPVQLENLIQGVLDEVAPLAKGRSCSIEFLKPSVSLPTILLDATLIRQTVHNLVTNAIKYSTGEHCLVQVSAGRISGREIAKMKGVSYQSAREVKPREEYALIQVTDHGLGIPKAVQARIFEKFFRADNAVRAQAEGSGLGLYVNKLILEKVGGLIWFVSEERKGTTFSVTIPLKGIKSIKGEVGLAEM